MTVVEEARIAAAYGVRDMGVTTLHDATEGGVIGGIFEIAQAADGHGHLDPLIGGRDPERRRATARTAGSCPRDPAPHKGTVRSAWRPHAGLCDIHQG